VLVYFGGLTLTIRHNDGIDEPPSLKPVLVLSGEDVIVSIESSRALTELIPDSQLVELSGCGHVPTMTRPSEVYEAISGRFAVTK
jgi:pimeloyl-ACP methyl ester carboxylesterase